MTAQEIEKEVRADGWYYHKTKGSHKISSTRRNPEKSQFHSIKVIFTRKRLK